MSARQERHSTFHEQWYLVEGLRPRLRPDVSIRRQMFWGQPWYILSEPDNNAHFRLARGGYAFVALLDGEKTVQEIWELCLAADEEEALTQGEVIALLGRLHSANLMLTAIPADTENLLRQRQEKTLKKLGSTLSSFLFLRIPICSPDAFFSRWQHVGSLIFRRGGFLAWLLLLLFALRSLFLNWDMFVYEARDTFTPANIFWVYAVIVLSKILHECGHAFACKHFSANDGARSDVHCIGIMFLFFAPVPYIDVSSSTQIRSKWQRAAVGLAGVYVELFLAFIAMLVWANTAPATNLHLLARNCVIITSVSTLLFNINPLLRFDGYFVFSDLLGMPNLYQRSQAYTVYLFKRHALGVERASTVVSKRGEKVFYPIYAVAAFFYRIFITVSIFLLLEDHFAALGILLASSLAFLWFGLPLLKGLAYLASGQEISGRRNRTLTRCGLAVGLVAVLFLVVPVEDAVVVEGIVEGRNRQVVFSEVEGVLAHFLPTDTTIPSGEKVVVAAIDNPGLESELNNLTLSAQVTLAKLEYAKDNDDAHSVGVYTLELQAQVNQLLTLRETTEKRTVLAPVGGVWVAPDLSRRQGKWISKGDSLGEIYAPEQLRLRVAVDQFDAARLFAEALRRAEFCLSGRMDMSRVDGRVFVALPEGQPVHAGRRELFHPSLAVEAGGESRVMRSEDGRILAANHFFELRLLPEEAAVRRLLPGQKVLVRLVFGEQPLGLQWLRRLRQFFTGRIL